LDFFHFKRFNQTTTNYWPLKSGERILPAEPGRDGVSEQNTKKVLDGFGFPLALGETGSFNIHQGAVDCPQGKKMQLISGEHWKMKSFFNLVFLLLAAGTHKSFEII
jgi:hypothetical protein